MLQGITISLSSVGCMVWLRIPHWWTLSYIACRFHCSLSRELTSEEVLWVRGITWASLVLSGDSDWMVVPAEQRRDDTVAIGERSAVLACRADDKVAFCSAHAVPVDSHAHRASWCQHYVNKLWHGGTWAQSKPSDNKTSGVVLKFKSTRKMRTCSRHV